MEQLTFNKIDSTYVGIVNRCERKERFILLFSPYIYNDEFYYKLQYITI